MAPRPAGRRGQSWQNALVYTRDVGENAYNRTRDLAYDWLRRVKGEVGVGGQVTPRGTAYYEYKQALRFGDTDAAKAAWKRMVELGVTKGDLESSLRNAHPLAAISKRDRDAFLATLSPTEAERLQIALRWYQDVYFNQSEIGP